jgi:hypothetical protein
VTELGCEAFCGCRSLRSIKIPPSVAHIGDSCFSRAVWLCEAIFESPSQVTSIGSGVFSNGPDLHFFYIPPRLQIIDGWPFSPATFMLILVDPENHFFRMIDSCLIHLSTHSIVRLCSKNTSVVISNSIQELGPCAFAFQTSLGRVSFEPPSIVVKFSTCVFLNCKSLESISIPASVRFIGSYCFDACCRLASVTFGQPSMLEVIDEAAFSCCGSLRQISIPASIQQIRTRCFEYCESLRSIEFESPSNLAVLCDLGDLAASSLEIPDSVEAIRGMTNSLRKRALVVSFDANSRLAVVCPNRSRKHGVAAFVRYSEATLRSFRANLDDFATLS